MVLSLRDSTMADDFEEDELHALQVAIKELKAKVELGASRTTSKINHMETVISSRLDRLEATILAMLPDDYKIAASVGSAKSSFSEPANVVSHSLEMQLEKEIDQVNQEGLVFLTEDENQSRAPLLLHHGPHSRVKTTGDVFCYEAIEELNIKTKNWKELLTDKPFIKDDLITIQNPNAHDSKVLLDFDHGKNNLKVDDGKLNKVGSDPTYNINVSGDIKQILQELGIERAKEATMHGHGGSKPQKLTGELNDVVGSFCPLKIPSSANFSHFWYFWTRWTQRDYGVWPIRLAFVERICKTDDCLIFVAEIYHLFPMLIHYCISPALSNLVFDPGGVLTNENLKLVPGLHHFVTVIVVALEVVTLRHSSRRIKLLSSLHRRLGAGEFDASFLSLHLFQLLHHCEHFTHLAYDKFVKVVHLNTFIVKELASALGLSPLIPAQDISIHRIRNADRFDTPTDFGQAQNTQLMKLGFNVYTYLGNRAFQIFLEMQNVGMRPSVFTYTIMMALMLSPCQGKQIHGRLIRSGIDFPDLMLGNSLINMYGNFSFADSSFDVILTMKKLDIISWNSLIWVCHNADNQELALEHFHRMRNSEILPDQFTSSILISMCSSLQDLEKDWRILYSFLEAFIHIMSHLVGKGELFESKILLKVIGGGEFYYNFYLTYHYALMTDKHTWCLEYCSIDSSALISYLIWPMANLDVYKFKEYEVLTSVTVDMDYDYIKARLFSLLKKCECLTEIPYMPLPLLTDMEGPLLQPLAILDTLTVRKQAQWVQQILVQWDGHGDSTWETLEEFKELYPSFDLGDKVALAQGSDVTRHAEDRAHANQAQSEYKPK